MQLRGGRSTDLYNVSLGLTIYRQYRIGQRSKITYGTIGRTATRERTREQVGKKSETQEGLKTYQTTELS